MVSESECPTLSSIDKLWPTFRSVTEIIDNINDDISCSLFLFFRKKRKTTNLGSHPAKLNLVMITKNSSKTKIYIDIFIKNKIEAKTRTCNNDLYD